MKNEYITFVKKHYNLKKLSMNLTGKRYLFLLYDNKYYYYLKNKKFLDLNSITNILKVIEEISMTCSIKITNYYPVCYCNQTLVIAFRVNESSTSYLEKVKSKGLPIEYKKLCSFHEDNFSTLYISSNVEKEISMSQKYIRRYRFHEKVIKRYFLTSKKRKKEEFYNLLVDLIPNRKSIIDISCGDNSDIFEIAKKKKYKTIVGNDICLNYLRIQNNSNVIFTNDNIEKNQIKEKSYDVSFVKNTLHHMNNLLGINNLLDMLDNISNEIVIVEILNPKEIGGLSKFLNVYLYTKFLKDVGRCYLSENQLKSIINSKFKGSKIEYQKFKNILGEYMIAKISKE
ncbi:MAG: hypothetical protein IJI22_03015 [Bacilli bacterium]|nr:hypothetical protein [Bacilli bacterium]